MKGSKTHGKPECLPRRELTKEFAKSLEAAAAEKGFSSPSAFIRSAIENELTSRKPVFDESEQRIIATIDRVVQEMRKLSTGQQALFAFVDSLTKALLTCVPEPSGEAYAQAVARAKAHYVGGSERRGHSGSA